MLVHNVVFSVHVYNIIVGRALAWDARSRGFESHLRQLTVIMIRVDQSVN